MTKTIYVSMKESFQKEKKREFLCNNSCRNLIQKENWKICMNKLIVNQVIYLFICLYMMKFMIKLLFNFQ